MEIIGDDKRIRALFSEARFAAEQVAPSFTAVWHRAESCAMRPHRAFNFSFVSATALLIFALGSLAIWSWYSQPATPAAAEAVLAAHFDVPPPHESTPQVTAPPEVKKTKSSAAKVAAQRQALIVANRKAEQQAKEIASWTSPTSSLLGSTSDELFKSLPQLNENSNELKSFLPSRSNEKEK